MWLEREGRAERVMLIDTHIDLPFRLSEQMADVAERTAEGDFDAPRAAEGGLDLAFLAIYVPSAQAGHGVARPLADRLIDLVERIASEHADRFALVTSPAEARTAFESERLGLALGIENGAALEGDLASLEHFARRGVRYVTLVHGETNELCDSSYDDVRRWNGLSPFGREAVLEMNRLGLLVDVSHASDAAVDAVLAASRAPIVATHSSCRHFTPGWERNLGDESIRRIARASGVVHINFGSSFISDRYRRAREAVRARIEAELVERGLGADSAAARELARQRFRESAIEVASVSEVADHVDHVVALAGIDHVGIGSDFEGVGETLPAGLEDVSCYPNLFRALRARGHDFADLEKIAGGNFLRVWSEARRDRR